MTNDPCPPQQKQIVKRAVPLGDWPRPYDQIQVALPEAPPLYVPPQAPPQEMFQQSPARVGNVRAWTGAIIFTALAVGFFVSIPTTQPPSPQAAPASNLTATTVPLAGWNSRLYKTETKRFKETITLLLMKTGWSIDRTTEFLVVATYDGIAKREFLFTPSQQGGTWLTITGAETPGTLRDEFRNMTVDYLNAMQELDETMARQPRRDH
jgi:hypothetical protein